MYQQCLKYPQYHNNYYYDYHGNHQEHQNDQYHHYIQDHLFIIIVYNHRDKNSLSSKKFLQLKILEKTNA